MKPFRIERLAPAKINLCLRVLGRRGEGEPKAGYHEIDSIVVFASVGDRLRFATAPKVELLVEGPFAAALAGEPDNLVLRAARLLAEAAGVESGAAIVLEKNLPVAAGIGGGSADAAAALLGLAALWGLDAEALALPSLAARLGADVPVCLTGRACRVQGIGEQVTPLPPLPPAHLLLVNPLQPLPTPPVFAARRGDFNRPLEPRPEHFADAAGLARLIRAGGNDLTDAARLLLPAVGRVLDRLQALAPLAAAMSGSGASCFALYAEAEEAERAAEELRGLEPGWWINAAPLLN